jgi:hypothetical protein
LADNAQMLIVNNDWLISFVLFGCAFLSNARHRRSFKKNNRIVTLRAKNYTIAMYCVIFSPWKSVVWHFDFSIQLNTLRWGEPIFKLFVLLYLVALEQEHHN